MADREIPTVRIVQNTHDPNLKQVGLVSGTSGYLPNQIKQVYQAADVATHNLYETVQGITGAVTGLPVFCNLGTEGGGSGYHADAVHFDGLTNFVNNALTATDSFDVSLVGWFKSTNAFNQILSTDPDDTVNNVFYLVNTVGRFGFELGDIPFINTVEPQTDSAFDFTDNEWHCCIFSANTNHAAGSRVFRFYIDDVDRTDLTPGSDSGSAFMAAFSGVKCLFGTDGFDPFIGDMADFRLMIGTSLLVAGDIPEAKRRLFVDAGGKPVDPADATAALGAPTLLFSGNAAAWISQMTAQGFSVGGGTLTDASTSPSS